MPVQPDVSVVAVVEQLNKYSVEAAFIVPTLTGLKKSILDAIAPVRDYLQRAGVHDYESQGQGPSNKRLIKTYFIGPNGVRETTTSLYRPVTKNGDPRIWFSGLQSYAREGNLLAITVVDDELWVINTSIPEIMESFDNSSTPLGQLAIRLRQLSPIASELLSKLKGIASQGLIKSVTAGDTGVGATLEHALGIRINSSRTPDYKGIELKAKRLNLTGVSRENRVNLFAQVPNWALSECQSSTEILNKYGYHRDGAFRLYCTVSALGPNPQGLFLAIDNKLDYLREQHTDLTSTQEVVVWELEKLRDRLLEKHKETFWVSAKTIRDATGEYFQYQSVLHTQSPRLAYLSPLIQEGVITVDHLIKRVGSSGREKGPFFKILPTSLKRLFPPPKEYELL